MRQRKDVALGGIEVYEVRLGDDYLMSSLFYTAEVALADLGLADSQSPELDVVVGGLGLGYTAVAALGHPTVKSLIVVEALQPVIDWHRNELVPLGSKLNLDPRCQFVCNSFFELSDSDDGFNPDQPGQKVHAVLLDIDHSPEKLLHDDNQKFYTPAGLSQLANHLLPTGVLAMWSNDPPDDSFLKCLRTVFEDVTAQEVPFHNPYQEREEFNTVYVARIPLQKSA